MCMCNEAGSTCRAIEWSSLDDEILRCSLLLHVITDRVQTCGTSAVWLIKDFIILIFHGACDSDYEKNDSVQMMLMLRDLKSEKNGEKLCECIWGHRLSHFECPQKPPLRIVKKSHATKDVVLV